MVKNHQNKAASKKMATRRRRILIRTQPKTNSKWKWMGFKGKTLWDGLDLLAKLAIPLVVVGATILFGMQQANLAQQQHANDQQLALDQQQQTTLKTSIDDIKDLLFNRSLKASKSKDEVRVVARGEVLVALRQLDIARKGLLIQFLAEAGLINGEGNDVIIVLDNANLNSAYLSGAGLDGVHLRSADLRGAHLDGAHLRHADLTGAYLDGANLGGADLMGAHLDGAHLDGANLTDALNFTPQQLDQVYSCKNATLPTGLTCHHNQ